jgi:hypothetical protein
MTRNERFALRLSASWLELMTNFVKPTLTDLQRRQLLAKRELMRESARRTSPDSIAGLEAVDLLCDVLRSGLDPFETDSCEESEKD